MIWSKKLSKSNTTAILRHLPTCALCMCFAGIAHAQNITVSEPFTDGNAKKRTELLAAFSSLHHDITNGIENGLDNSDKAIVANAMTSTPYLVDAYRVLESACDYYYSTPTEDLDAEVLALYLAETHQVELNSKQAFFEQSYNVLSNAGKSKFDSLTEAMLILSDFPTNEKQEYLENLLDDGPEYTLLRYENFCNALPEFKSRAESNVNIHIEHAIPIGGQTNE